MVLMYSIIKQIEFSTSEILIFRSLEASSVDNWHINKSGQIVLSMRLRRATYDELLTSASVVLDTVSLIQFILHFFAIKSAKEMPPDAEL